MTIVHVVFSLSIGGIETMLVNLSNIQANLGHDVHIIVINDILDESLVTKIEPIVKFHAIGRKRGSRNPWPIIKMNLLISKLHPDVIHMHTSHISRYIFLPWHKAKFCNTLHSMCTPSNTINIEHAGQIFAISNVVKDDIKQKTGLESITVKNGVIFENIPQRIYTASQPIFRVVQVGRLVHTVKGQDILIKAIKIIKDKGYNIQLTLIGEGESFDFLKKLTDDLELTDDIIFLGSKPHAFVMNNLKNYDLLVQPSRIEGFGLTVAEAMAAYLPVLVADNDGPQEVIDYGRFGKIFKKEDVEDCAAKIIETISQYPTQEYLKDAYDYVTTEFNLYNTAKRYLELYDRLIINHA